MHDPMGSRQETREMWGDTLRALEKLVWLARGKAAVVEMRG